MALISTPLLYGIILGILDVVALSLLKLYKLGTIKSWWVFVVAFLLYGCHVFIFYKALNQSTLAQMNFLADLMSGIFVTFISLYLFKENVTDKQLLGIGIGLFALFLLK